MSKMFEALKKAQGELAEIGLPLIVNAGPVPGPASPAQEAAVDAPDVEAKLPPGDEHELREEIRAVSIRVGNGSAVLALDRPNLRAADQYRVIRTRIVQHSRRPKLISVS